jgi:hypothetical protein
MMGGPSMATSRMKRHFDSRDADSRNLRECVFTPAGDGGRVGPIAVPLRFSVTYMFKVLSGRRQIGGMTAWGMKL